MSTSTLRSSEARGAALWPVPCGATRRPCSRATSITATTSSADSAIATAAGSWSTERFQARRASSQRGSCGPTTRPRAGAEVVQNSPERVGGEWVRAHGRGLLTDRGERNGARILCSRACTCDPPSGAPSGRRPWFFWRGTRCISLHQCPDVRELSPGAVNKRERYRRPSGDRTGSNEYCSCAPCACASGRCRQAGSCRSRPPLGPRTRS